MSSDFSNMLGMDFDFDFSSLMESDHGIDIDPFTTTDNYLNEDESVYVRTDSQEVVLNVRSGFDATIYTENNLQETIKPLEPVSESIQYQPIHLQQQNTNVVQSQIQPDDNCDITTLVNAALVQPVNQNHQVVDSPDQPTRFVLRSQFSNDDKEVLAEFVTLDASLITRTSTNSTSTVKRTKRSVTKSESGEPKTGPSGEPKAGPSGEPKAAARGKPKAAARGKPKAAPSRKRIRGPPTGKLYEVTEPFEDPVKEQKRRNAIKANKNRKIAQNKYLRLESLNDELQRENQNKDARIIEQDTIITEKNQRITDLELKNKLMNDRWDKARQEILNVVG